MLQVDVPGPELLQTAAGPSDGAVADMARLRGPSFGSVFGVAFDAAGRRLGYGGGFYDRLLPLVRAGVPRIAGAFDVQIVDEVPAGPQDRRVDAVVSPTRTLVQAS